MLLRSRLLFSESLDYVGLSEREVARKAGLGHSTVNHLMTGRRVTCSMPTAVAIELVLGLPPGLLFTPQTEREYQLLSNRLQPAVDTVSRNRDRVTCPVCSRDCAVRKDGHVISHHRPDRLPCPGSFQVATIEEAG